MIEIHRFLICYIETLRLFKGIAISAAAARLPDGQITPSDLIHSQSPSLRLKKIPLSPSGKSPLWLVASRALQEGRIAIVTKRWRGMRWTLSMCQTSALEADGKAVWS
jgi:hypothetical protein